jgi:hypothetical protein
LSGLRISSLPPPCSSNFAHSPISLTYSLTMSYITPTQLLLLLSFTPGPPHHRCPPSQQQSPPSAHIANINTPLTQLPAGLSWQWCITSWRAPA